MDEIQNEDKQKKWEKFLAQGPNASNLLSVVCKAVSGSLIQRQAAKALIKRIKFLDPEEQARYLRPIVDNEYKIHVHDDVGAKVEQMLLDCNQYIKNEPPFEQRWDDLLLLANLRYLSRYRYEEKVLQTARRLIATKIKEEATLRKRIRDIACSGDWDEKVWAIKMILNSNPDSEEMFNVVYHGIHWGQCIKVGLDLYARWVKRVIEIGCASASLMLTHVNALPDRMKRENDEIHEQKRQHLLKYLATETWLRFKKQGRCAHANIHQGDLHLDSDDLIRIYSHCPARYRTSVIKEMLRRDDDGLDEYLLEHAPEYRITVGRRMLEPV